MIKKSLLFGTVALATAVPAFAQEAEAEATTAVAPNTALEEVLANVPKLMNHHWQTTMNIAIQEGENPSQDVKIGLKFMDRNHFTVKLNTTVPGEFEDQKIDVDVVADGTYLFLNAANIAEMSGGMFSGPLKVELATVWKMVDMMAPSGAMQEGEVNTDGLTKMVREAASQFTFKEEGSTEGSKRYVMGNDDVSGHIVFSAKSWLPKSMEMAGPNGEGSMKMTTENSNLVEAFPEGTFTFTPAEGVTVTDLTSMVQMQMNQMGGGMEEEEDLEF